MSLMLTENEKQVFTKVLCRLIRADGNFNVNEIHSLGNYATRHGIPIAEVRNIINSSSADNIVAEVGCIQERPKALELIKEMCIVANSDNDFADAEMNLILQVADALKVDITTIAQINEQLLAPQELQAPKQTEAFAPVQTISGFSTPEACFPQPNLAGLIQPVYHVPEFKDTPGNKFSGRLTHLLSLRGIEA